MTNSSLYQLTLTSTYLPDPPIKRFAQRHIYLGTDAIAARDLGFAVARKHNKEPSSAPGKTETQASVTNNASTSTGKRPASPDQGGGGGRGVKREENTRNNDFGGGGYKRARGGASPARGDRDVPMRERDKDQGNRERDGPRGDRWGGEGGGGAGGKGRKFSPAPSGGSGWERDRDDREGRGYGRDVKREESFGGRGGGVQIPPVVAWFIGELPPASTFDGVYCQDLWEGFWANLLI